MKGYTSRDVAKLLGLTVAQVRGFARDGFLTPGRGPRGELQFSFQDLVILRTAKGLVAARIPTRRIRRALRRLRSELPRGRSLAELRITAEDDRIVVSDGESTWSPESDQMQIDFAISDLATRAAPMARRGASAPRRPRPPSAGGSRWKTWAARRMRSTRIARRSPRIRSSPMRITTWRGCTRRRERKRRRCGTSPVIGDSQGTSEGADFRFLTEAPESASPRASAHPRSPGRASEGRLHDPASRRPRFAPAFPGAALPRPPASNPPRAAPLPPTNGCR